MKAMLFGLLSFGFMLSDSVYSLSAEQNVMEQTDQQKENEKWLNGIKVWQEKSKKADLVVSCVGIDEDRCKLRGLSDLHITVDGIMYSLVRVNNEELKLYRGVEATDLFEGNWKSSEEATTVLPNVFTTTVTKVDKDSSRIRIKISSQDGQNHIETDWIPSRNKLVIHDTSCENLNCAFAGKSVYMASGKDGSNTFEDVGILTNELKIFSDIDGTNIYAISPAVCKVWRTDKGFANLNSLEGLSCYDNDDYEKYFADEKSQLSKNMTPYQKHALNIGLLELAKNLGVVRDQQNAITLGENFVIFKTEQGEEIQVLVNNIGGTLYFFDPINKREFNNPIIKHKLRQAINKSGLTIKRPINYIDPDKK